MADWNMTSNNVHFSSKQNQLLIVIADLYMQDIKGLFVPLLIFQRYVKFR